MVDQAEEEPSEARKRVRKDARAARFCCSNANKRVLPWFDHSPECVNRGPESVATVTESRSEGSSDHRGITYSYELDELSVLHALERFSRDTLCDLNIIHKEESLRLALRSYFPQCEAPLQPINIVRDETKPEFIAGLMGKLWPIDKKTGQAPEAIFERGSPARHKAYKQSRAIAVKRVIGHLEQLDKLYPSERKRTGSHRAIKKSNYAESVKKSLQQFAESWPDRDLKAAVPPLTSSEYYVLKLFEYENYIDVLYGAAVALREVRLIEADLRAWATSQS